MKNLQQGPNYLLRSWAGNFSEQKRFGRRVDLQGLWIDWVNIWKNRKTWQASIRCGWPFGERQGCRFNERMRLTRSLKLASGQRSLERIWTPHWSCGVIVDWQCRNLCVAGRQAGKQTGRRAGGQAHRQAERLKDKHNNARRVAQSFKG